MKLLDLLNVIEDDTPIWIYIDHPFPCRKEGLFFGAVQFAAENDSEWEGYRVVLTFPELYKSLGGVDGGGRIALEELPVNPEWCQEDVEAWFTENRYIHGVNSQYDCTGCLFTEWFKVFRRRGRWYAYHCIGMDI